MKRLNDFRSIGIRPGAIAASFIRPQRRFDPARTLLEAVEDKYGSQDRSQERKPSDSITISGKQVHEVGFDIIAQQQAAWSELKTLSLNECRVQGELRMPSYPRRQTDPDSHVLPIDVKWQELDLSKNLFETWDEILDIGEVAKELRILTLR